MPMTDPLRGWAALALLLAYAAMCLGVAWRTRRQRRSALRAAQALSPGTPGQPRLLVAHASQTGTAESWAWTTARLLHDGGLGVHLLPLGQVTPEVLAGVDEALLIVSTCGEGDPPDAALPFVHSLMRSGREMPGLAHLRVGLLALGDRSYAQFCAFGRRLDDWLQARGAQALFERIEADAADPAAWQQWQQAVTRVAGLGDLAPVAAHEPFTTWRLAARRHLNPGSQGGPCFHLELEPADPAALPAWEAGDLVQVNVPGQPGRPREYSIASVPADRRLHLLVRQTQREDGSPGLASGWLTAQAAPGDAIELRLRPHRNFRIGNNHDRPLILIGNGTGLAGLRAHLLARARQHPRPPAWLIFGERQRACDAFLHDELQARHREGVLQRLDFAWSRDAGAYRYVQDCLLDAADDLRRWVGSGAALYVCGSLRGMAGGVDRALNDILGSEPVLRLLEQGRYRRDVY